jgi:hypothetical protein
VFRKTTSQLQKKFNPDRSPKRNRQLIDAIRPFATKLIAMRAFPSTPSISFGRAQNHLDLKEGVRSYSPARNAGLSLIGSSRITES